MIAIDPMLLQNMIGSMGRGTTTVCLRDVATFWLPVIHVHVGEHGRCQQRERPQLDI